MQMNDDQYVLQDESELLAESLQANEFMQSLIEMCECLNIPDISLNLNNG